MRRLVLIADALSQLANVALLPSPHDTTANESVSGRAHRLRWTSAERWIDRLIFWEREHCRVSHEADVRRAKDLLGLP